MTVRRARVGHAARTKLAVGPRRVATAVVGCGSWGAQQARVLSSLDALHSMSDANPTRAEEVAMTFSRPVLHFEEVLANPDIVAVVLATPPETHADLAYQALAAGKDVLVEKPLAFDAIAAEKLTCLAATTKRILMVGHLMRYHPAFVALAALVHEGRLGDIQYIHSRRLNFGRFRRGQSVLWSFAPHDVSMILALLRRHPERVDAAATTCLHHTGADVVETHLVFPRGVSAQVVVSWFHPRKAQELVVIGDRAMAVFDDTLAWPEKLRLYDHHIDWTNPMPRAVAVTVNVLPAEPLLRECEHFLDCVRERRTPLTDGNEGTDVVSVLERAQRSIQSPIALSKKDRGSVSFHASAFVDDGAIVGPGTRIWHFSHVMSGARIGRDCSLGQNVFVGRNVVIGDRVRIQNNVSVFDGVMIEADVFCGPSVVFTNVLNPRAQIDRRLEFSPTVVRQGATIGANATVICGNEIGEFALVGAGAVVTKNVGAHAVVVGVPARQIGWASHSGEVLGQDLVCPRTGRRYEVRNDGLVEVE